MGTQLFLTAPGRAKGIEMAIVRVSHNVSDAALARIEAVIEKTLNYDPNWNGASITIERDEFTCVECSDDLAGAQLLAKINRAIDPE